MYMQVLILIETDYILRKEQNHYTPMPSTSLLSCPGHQYGLLKGPMGLGEMHNLHLDTD